MQGGMRNARGDPEGGEIRQVCPSYPSHAVQLVSKMRHSLSDESTRAATVLSSWHTMPDLIPRNEIVSVFKDKSKCPKKGKGKDTGGSDVIDGDTDI
jgi:hypothetical protein